MPCLTLYHLLQLQSVFHGMGERGMFMASGIVAPTFRNFWRQSILHIDLSHHFPSGFPMIFLRFSWGKSFIFPWFSHDFHDIPMIFMNVPWVSWFSHDFPMIFPGFRLRFPALPLHHQHQWCGPGGQQYGAAHRSHQRLSDINGSLW